VSAPAATRRFVCSDCKYVHHTWAARCARCTSLKGLVLAAGTGDDQALPVPAPADLAEASQEFAESPRPRLVIARSPSPEPELTDPVQELVDLGPSASGPVPISEIAEATFVRDSTGLPPLDHVLGGGLVVASVVLLASPPGVGKTSLTLQMLDGLQHRCLYVTGEETREQVAATARRIGAVSNRIYVLAERNLEKIFAHARMMRAQTIVIDSIQKMVCDDVSGRAGSTTQLKECTARLVQYAKTTGTALWLIGHVTGDGDIAGPRTIEHDVDVVLELDRGPKFEGNERILRCSSKNRFGATNVVGCFELTARGFVAVDADGWNEEL
jgi:predicted ATP-dependent serine protease